MERETGIEPVTSSLGSWRSTAELLPLATALDYHPASPKGNVTAIQRCCYLAADAEDELFDMTKPIPRPPPAPARIPSRISTGTFSRRELAIAFAITPPKAQVVWMDFSI